MQPAVTFTDEVARNVFTTPFEKRFNASDIGTKPFNARLRRARRKGDRSRTSRKGKRQKSEI